MKPIFAYILWALFLVLGGIAVGELMLYSFARDQKNGILPSKGGDSSWYQDYIKRLTTLGF